MFKKINIIVCCDKSNGIGKDNSLPWNIKSEMNIFKKKTIGEGNNCVIMGKNTYNSIPLKYRPLNNRVNYVISSTVKKDKSIHVIENLKNDLINIINNTTYDVYWIIGGEAVYNIFMTEYIKLINEIHISIINNDYKCNKFFPEIDKNLFRLIDSTENIKDNYIHYVYKSKINNQKMDCL